jgi:hypothetical protein
VAWCFGRRWCGGDNEFSPTGAGGEDTVSYARLELRDPVFGDSEQYDAIASADIDAPWCELPRTTPTGATCEPIIRDSGGLMYQVAQRKPLTAPMLALGQAADPPYGVYDLHVDHLGSTRVVTDYLLSIVSRHDFFPFGEEVAPVFDYND